MKPPARASATRGRLRAHQPKVVRRQEDTGEVALDVRAMIAEERAKRQSKNRGVVTHTLPSGSPLSGGPGALAHIGVSAEVNAEAIDREPT